ncbi:MAG TPA: host attachment protein [Kofleriaceae bacterium]|nr:host attachment protein [Kofleriaceae bacterium]
MYRACIAIIDAAHARLYTFERSSDASGIHEEFSERRDLVNLGRRKRPSEKFSDSRPGSSRTGGLQYTFDDHRDANIEAQDAGFARTIIKEVGELLRNEGAQRLIVCASPRMLGEVREVRDELHNDALVIDEVPRDLVRLTTAQLREQLTEYGLLPPRVAEA